MEKLIPFDFEAFKADPSRLRRRTGETPLWAEPVRGCVAAQFQYPFALSTLLFAPSEFELLALAAKTRIVRVRLFRNSDGDVFARTSDGVELDQADYVGNSWVSEIIEVEVTA